MKKPLRKALKQEWEYFLSDLSTGWKGGSKNPLAYVAVSILSVFNILVYIIRLPSFIRMYSE
jgi:hypothetical protein